MNDLSGPRWRGGVVVAAVLALGLLGAAAVFGLFFHASRANGDLVRVVGSATEGFDSDVAKWRLNLARPAPGTDLGRGYSALHDDVEAVVAALRAAGVPDSAISTQPVSAQPMWNRDGERTGFNVQQAIHVLSGDPGAIERLANDPGALLPSGVVLEYSQIEYFFSGIADLKRSLLAAATSDARARAQEIAGSSDRGLGHMVSARAGVFQITEPYSTEVSGAGMYSTATRKKEITVTVHAEFELD